MQRGKRDPSVTLLLTSGNLVLLTMISGSSSSNGKHLRNRQTASSTSGNSSSITRRGPLVRRGRALGASSRVIIVNNIVAKARGNHGRGRGVRRMMVMVAMTGRPRGDAGRGMRARAPRAGAADATDGSASSASAARRLAANRTLGDGHGADNDDALSPWRIGHGLTKGDASISRRSAKGLWDRAGRPRGLLLLRAGITIQRA